MTEKKFTKIIVEWSKWIVLGAYGYAILIVDVVPDSNVRRPMNEINAPKFTHARFLLSNTSLGRAVLQLSLPTKSFIRGEASTRFYFDVFCGIMDRSEHCCKAYFCDFSIKDCENSQCSSFYPNYNSVIQKRGVITGSSTDFFILPFLSRDSSKDEGHSNPLSGSRKNSTGEKSRRRRGSQISLWSWNLQTAAGHHRCTSWKCIWAF